MQGSALLVVLQLSAATTEQVLGAPKRCPQRDDLHRAHRYYGLVCHAQQVRDSTGNEVSGSPLGYEDSVRLRADTLIKQLQHHLSPIPNTRD